MSKLWNFIDKEEHFQKVYITQNYKRNININYFWTGDCAADDDCDGDPICKTDNTCGMCTYSLIYEISLTKIQVPINQNISNHKHYSTM